MMLFLSNTLSNDNSSTKPSGIDLPIPVIHEVIDESRFPKVHDDNITKEDLSQLLFNKIEFTPIPASQESEQIINLAFSDASIPSSPVDRCVGEHALSNLFIFKVPRLNPEGTCSNLHDLSDRPYNLAVDAYGISEDALAAFLSNRSHPLIIRTSRLNRAVNLLYLLTTADWIGIYRVVDADSELGLLKEAYLGEPSRAVFPLTEAFSLKSTNSWVGLNGQIRHIPNTRARAEGVSYYECSGSVQSEICVPILRSFPTQTGSEWRVIGIIDLESWKPNHFTPQMIRDVLEVGFHLGGCDEFFKLPKY